MTYVELFDKTSIENICAILTNVPNRVVLVGNNKKKIERCIKHYKKVFSKRGYNIEFVSKAVSKWDIEQVVQVLTEILNTYEDCEFGVTGGDEIALVALGILYERNRDKNIQIHRIGINNNRIYDCDKDGNTIEKDIPSISVEENVRIYGGDVMYGDVTEEETYQWSLTPEFCKDIETMWSICSVSVTKWNIQSRVFETIGEVGDTSADGLTVIATKEAIRKYYQKNKVGKYSVNYRIINGLRDMGNGKLITFFEDSPTEVKISYKDLQVKKCLTKAGLALEMIIYLTAKKLKDESGKNIYDDVVNGVKIDWDGIIHEEMGGTHDTTNEIDVLLTHGMVPIFISCKNGKVSVEELYKLNTVAERFGGKYSKKVLVATNLPGEESENTYFKLRANDMKIKILDEVQNMTLNQLAKELNNLWEE